MYGLGIVATIIGIVGGIPYIYNTVRGKTKPHRIAWAIFLVLSVIAFFSQLSLGARASLIFYGWFMVNNLILTGLSLRKNGGYGDISPLNIFCILLAALAIVLWKITDSPALALTCTLIADGVGALLIVVKSYHHPETETITMWYAGCVATFLNVLAVGSLKAPLLAAPVQIFLFNVAIAIAILAGRKAHPTKKMRPRKTRTI